MEDLPEPPPRRSAQTADLGLTFRVLLRTSGVVFVVSLVLVLLDAAAGIRLPGAIRPALPWALVASTLVGIVLLVGALGMPKRPEPRRHQPRDDG